MLYTRFYLNDYIALVYKFPSDYYHALTDAIDQLGCERKKIGIG